VTVVFVTVASLVTYLSL